MPEINWIGGVVAGLFAQDSVGLISIEAGYAALQ